MARLPPVAHGGRQIRWAKKHPVHPFHCCNGGQLCHRLHGFGLHQQAHFIVGAVQVILNLVPAGRPRQRRTHPPDAFGWIAHRLHHLRRLLGRVDHRDEQGLRANVQVLLDQGHVRLHGPHDRMHRVRRHSAQLGQGVAWVVGGVLAVQEQPIETRAGQQFSGVGIGQTDPQANLTLTRSQGIAERVAGKGHHVESHFQAG